MRIAKNSNRTPALPNSRVRSEVASKLLQSDVIGGKPSARRNQRQTSEKYGVST
jgi:hypothetical protein